MSEEMNKGSIILYQTPDGQSKIEVVEDRSHVVG